MTVNILGTKYRIFEYSPQEDPFLNDCDGYCDKTSRKIVVVKRRDNCELDDWEFCKNKVLRHEIIHAFLYESGLQENFKHPDWGHEETMIDWIACQFPKILKAFTEVGCL